MKSNVRDTIVALVIWLAIISPFLVGMAIQFKQCSDYIGGERRPTGSEYTREEVGDFIVLLYEDHCDIIGTTEQGKSKRVLVIPEYINGVRVDCLGARRGYEMRIDGMGSPNMSSEVLEKIYFERAIDFYPDLRYAIKNLAFNKVIYPGVEPYPEDTWGTDMYFPRSAYEQNEAINKDSNKHPANVSFYYNYEGAINRGYYWIDDCDYGGKIEYIPKEPTRKGYTFGGWYKEEECINPWSFENDRLPDERFDEIEEIRYGETVITLETIYQETILYAKWIAN